MGLGRKPRPLERAVPKESGKDMIEEHKDEREGSKERNIIMYIYCVLINAQSAHIIHIDLNTIFLHM